LKNLAEIVVKKGNIHVSKQCGNTRHIDTLSFAASVNNAVEMSAIWDPH